MDQLIKLLQDNSAGTLQFTAIYQREAVLKNHTALFTDLLLPAQKY